MPGPVEEKPSEPVATDGETSSPSPAPEPPPAAATVATATAAPETPPAAATAATLSQGPDRGKALVNALATQSDELRNRKKSQKRLQFTLRAGLVGCLVIGSALLILGLGWLGTSLLTEGWEAFAKHTGDYYLVIGGVTFICFSLWFGGALTTVNDEIQSIEFEEDLLRFAPNARENRAEKLLRICQYQLRRYYDLNLGQNTWAFVTGGLCILSGVGIIVYTLYLTGKADGENKVIVGVVGAIGGILTNFVGAVYLQVYKSVSDSMREFHSKLVFNYELFLSNLLLSRISDKAKRWAALEQLALLIPRRSSQPSGPDGGKGGQ